MSIKNKQSWLERFTDGPSVRAAMEDVHPDTYKTPPSKRKEETHWILISAGILVLWLVAALTIRYMGW